VLFLLDLQRQRQRGRSGTTAEMPGAAATAKPQRRKSQFEVANE
jgi:hypothetical protein